MNCVDASAFLSTAFDSSDCVAIFMKAYDTDRIAQRIGPVAMFREARWQTWLVAMNQYRFNVYVSVNSIAADKRRRTKDSIAAVRHVFLDVDRNLARILANVEARTDLPPVSYVLHSSPSRGHILWRVAGFTTDGVEQLQKHLARDLGTDRAATSCSQTTRVPGLLNLKYASPHRVSVEYCDTEAIYGPTDFPSIPQSPTILVSPTFRSTASAGPLAPLERARRYMATLPPAVVGQHGDARTFRVCCRLARGFELDDKEALDALAVWNTRCVPPWSERDLVEKLRRARRYGREPFGGLLRARQ